MRIVERVPKLTGRVNRYPYDEIAMAVARGQVVALDSKDYGGVQANTIRTTVQRYASHHGCNWKVETRGDTVYVSGGGK